MEMRRRLTLIGAMMVHLGDADGMVCGTVGAYHDHLRFVDEVIGRRPGDNVYAAMNILLLNERTVVLVDTHVNDEPTAEQIAEFTRMAAQAMRRMNLRRRSRCCRARTSARAARPQARRCAARWSWCARWSRTWRSTARCTATARWTRRCACASCLRPRSRARPICWCVRAWTRAHRLQPAQDGGRRQVAVGPFLLGANAPVHILTSSSTVRRIINMTAMTVLDANRAETSA